MVVLREKTFAIELTQSELDSLRDGNNLVIETAIHYILSQAREAGWVYQEIEEGGD